MGQVSAWLLSAMYAERAAYACKEELLYMPSALCASYLPRGNASHIATWKLKAGEMSSA